MEVWVSLVVSFIVGAAIPVISYVAVRFCNLLDIIVKMAEEDLQNTQRVTRPKRRRK